MKCSLIPIVGSIFKSYAEEALFFIYDITRAYIHVVDAPTKNTFKANS
jgi:hypothetical protein